MSVLEVPDQLTLDINKRVTHPLFGGGLLKAAKPDGLAAVVWDDGARRLLTPLDELTVPGIDDGQVEQQFEAAAKFARDVENEAWRLKVREAARERVQLEQAGDAQLPSLQGLEAFLAVEDEPQTHRVAGLWPKGGRVVLSAQHKAGKTTSVGNLVRCLVDGDPFLSMFDVEQVDRVILVDNELDERMLRRWLRQQGVQRVDAVELIALRGRASSFDLLTPATRSLWAEHLGPADVLILDCLRPALDALALSEDKDAGRFLESLDELTTEAGITETLVVHHMGHNGERSRGDSRILDWPDALWKLIREQDPEGRGDGPSSRYFTAYGRDVDQAETLLSFDPSTKHLMAAGGSRKQRKVDDALAVVVDLLAATTTALSSNAIETHLKDAEPGRAAVRAAIKHGVESGAILVESGDRGARLHFLNPSRSPVRHTSPHLAGRSGRDLASAPLGRGEANSPDGDLANPAEPARSDDEQLTIEDAGVEA